VLYYINMWSIMLWQFFIMGSFFYHTIGRLMGVQKWVPYFWSKPNKKHRPLMSTHDGFVWQCLVPSP
jgi:hypothetical protein